MGTRKALPVVLLLLAAACGGDPAAVSTSPQPGDTTTPTAHTSEPGNPPGTSGETSAELGSCTLTVTGDFEYSGTFVQHNSSIVTDYWMTEEELRSTFEFMQEVMEEATFEERVANGEPIVGFFFFNCGEGIDPENPTAPSDEPSVIAFESGNNTPDDWPMGPGTYTLAGATIFEEDGPAGSFHGDLFVDEESVFRPVPESGSLVIETWDASRLAGTMTFDVVEVLFGEEGDEREASVTVEFDYLCNDFHSACR